MRQVSGRHNHNPIHRPLLKLFNDMHGQRLCCGKGLDQELEPLEPGCISLNMECHSFTRRKSDIQSQFST